jgi:hypothetical protein
MRLGILPTYKVKWALTTSFVLEKRFETSRINTPFIIKDLCKGAGKVQEKFGVKKFLFLVHGKPNLTVFSAVRMLTAKFSEIFYDCIIVF